MKDTGAIAAAMCSGLCVFIGTQAWDTANAWSSVPGPWSDPVHQTAIQNVPDKDVSQADRDTLEGWQQVIDKDQEATQSAEHAMTGITDSTQDESKQRKIYIGVTEALLKTDLQLAIDARRKHDAANALPPLAKAIHALEDATSPAHRGFQVWSSQYGILEMATHVLKERVYPVDDANDHYKSRLERAVKYAYDIYLERTPLPPRFISDDGCLLIIDPQCHSK